jgi:actin-like protein 6A
MSIPDMMVDSLNRCDPELKQELFSNIVLCGGSSLFKGFLGRIETDLMNKMSN